MILDNSSQAYGIDFYSLTPMTAVVRGNTFHFFLQDLSRDIFGALSIRAPVKFVDSTDNRIMNTGKQSPVLPQRNFYSIRVFDYYPTLSGEFEINGSIISLSDLRTDGFISLPVR